MKKIIFFFLALFEISFFPAQTGIGTTAPTNKLQVETTTADASSSGSSANGNLRLSGVGASHVLDFGLSQSASYSWLQARSKSSYSNNYNLILNPNGGNIGIGNTSPGDLLVVGSSFALHDGGNKVIGLGWSPGSGNALLSNFPAEIRLEPSIGRLSFGTSPNNVAGGSSAVVQQRMAITSQGRVGIGNNDPGATLEIGSSNGGVPGNLILNPTSTGTGVEGAEIDFRPAPIATSPAAQTWVIDQVSDANNPRLRFFPGSIGEHSGFTIKDNGFMGVGIANPNFKFHIKSANSTSMYIESTAADNNGMMILNANTNLNWAAGWHEFIMFQNQGTTIGQIVQTNANTVSYNSTSDYRLKNDFKTFNGLELVNKIKTYDFAWKSDQSRMHGVIAHELQEVLPYLVSGQKDAVSEDGKIIPQTVDYSKLTPILVKAIQEQDQRIRDQQKQIETLQQKQTSIEERLLLLEGKK